MGKLRKLPLQPHFERKSFLSSSSAVTTAPNYTNVQKVHDALHFQNDIRIH
jgi:hypothetical protein